MKIKYYLTRFSWVSLGEVVSKLALLYVTVMIGRVVSNEAYGVFFAVSSLVGILAMLADFGAVRVFIREASFDKQKIGAIFNQFLIIKAVFTSVFYVSVLVAYFFVDATLRQYILLYGLFVACDAAVTFFISIFRVYEQYPKEVAIRSATRLLTVVCVTVFLFAEPSLNSVFLGYAVAGVLSLAVAAFSLRMFIGLDWRVDRAVFKSYLKESVVLGLSSIFWQIYYRVDSVMLYSMSGAVSAAVYGAAYTIFQFINTIPTQIMTIAYPRVTQLFSSDRVAYRKEMRLLHIFALIGGAVSLLLGWFFAPFIITNTFGHDYVDAIQLLRILLLSFPFLFLTHVYSITFIVTKNAKLLTMISGVGAIVNVVVNYTLIPLLHARGAAIATLITEACVCLVCIGVNARITNRQKV